MKKNCIAGINNSLVYIMFYLLICLFISRGLTPVVTFLPEQEDLAIQFAFNNSLNVMLFSFIPYILYQLFQFISLKQLSKNNSSDTTKTLAKSYIVSIICCLILSPIIFFITSASFESSIYLQMVKNTSPIDLNMITTINRSYQYVTLLILGVLIIIDVVFLILKKKYKSIV